MDDLAQCMLFLNSNFTDMQTRIQQHKRASNMASAPTADPTAIPAIASGDSGMDGVALLTLVTVKPTLVYKSVWYCGGKYEKGKE